MPTSTVDPVPAIAETDATGHIATVFADIRQTLGVPVVNLIWRHLATIPGGLDWAWTSARPLYVNGDVSTHARSLKNTLNIPRLPGITTSTLAAIDLSAEDLNAIATVVASYERSNARNLVAMGALLAELDNVAPQNGNYTPHPGADDAVRGSMPALPSLNDMRPPVRALVDDLNHIGRRESVMPTMYRHLSHWPGFLSQLYVLLKPLDADGRLESMIVTAADEGLHRGATLRGALATAPATLSADERGRVRNGIQLFIDEPIAKMTAIGGLIDAAMP